MALRSQKLTYFKADWFGDSLWGRSNKQDNEREKDPWNNV